MRGVLQSFLIWVARIGRSAATAPVTRVYPIVKRSDGSRHPGPPNREAQRRLPSRVILDCEPHRRWNPWYRSDCIVSRRFSSLGRHRFAVVSLARKTSVATTSHRDWPHLALQLRNAHHRNLGCGQSPLKHSASCLADVAHTQRIGRSRMGMVVFSSSQIVCVRRLARVRHIISCSASRDLVQRVCRARLCIRAISTLVGSCHVCRFRFLRTVKATATVF